MILIVGVGRSGTSLLQSMLNAHPEMCFAPETGFIRRYLATGKLESVCRSRGVDGVLEHLRGDQLLERLGFDDDQLQDIVSSMGDSFSSAGLYLRLIKGYAETKGCTGFIGDKDPRSVEFLPLIYKHFPHAHVLHIVRDPRDVLVSKKKADWSRNRSWLGHILANRVQLKMGRKFGRELFGPRYMELTYEDLIASPRGVLEKICRRVKLDFTREMLDFADSSRELVSQDEMQWKAETLGPLLSTNKGKWTNELTPWAIALTERLCGEAFDSFNYERSGAKANLGLVSRILLGPISMSIAMVGFIYGLLRQWRQG